MDAITELNYKVVEIVGRIRSEMQNEPEPQLWQAYVNQKDPSAAHLTYLLHGWPYRLNEPVRFTDLTELENKLREHRLLPPGEIHPVRPPDHAAADVWDFCKVKFGMTR